MHSDSRIVFRLKYLKKIFIVIHMSQNQLYIGLKYDI